MRSKLIIFYTATLGCICHFPHCSQMSVLFVFLSQERNIPCLQPQSTSQRCSSLSWQAPLGFFPANILKWWSTPTSAVILLWLDVTVLPEHEASAISIRLLLTVLQFKLMWDTHLTDVISAFRLPKTPDHPCIWFSSTTGGDSFLFVSSSSKGFGFSTLVAWFFPDPNGIPLVLLHWQRKGSRVLLQASYQVSLSLGSPIYSEAADRVSFLSRYSFHAIVLDK